MWKTGPTGPIYIFLLSPYTYALFFPQWASGAPHWAAASQCWRLGLAPKLQHCLCGTYSPILGKRWWISILFYKVTHPLYLQCSRKKSPKMSNLILKDTTTTKTKLSLPFPESNKAWKYIYPLSDPYEEIYRINYITNYFTAKATFLSLNHCSTVGSIATNFPYSKFSQTG